MPFTIFVIPGIILLVIGFFSGIKFQKSDNVKKHNNGVKGTNKI